MPPQWHPWGIYMWTRRTSSKTCTWPDDNETVLRKAAALVLLFCSTLEIWAREICAETAALEAAMLAAAIFDVCPAQQQRLPPSFLSPSLPLQWAIPFLHAASRILWRQRARACHSHSPRFVWIEEGERERDEALTRGWNPNPWLKSPAVSASPPQDPWPRSVHRWPSILAVPFPPVVRTGWGRMDGSDWLDVHRTAGGDGMPAWGRNTHGLDRLAVSGSNPLYPNWEVKTVVGTRPGL